MLRVIFVTAAILSVSSVFSLSPSSVAADVAPGCLAGPKQRLVNGPGEPCGDHGPRWHADCRTPAESWNMPGRGSICSKRCTNDADCAPLGAGFSCSEHGRLYSEPSGPEGPICNVPRDR